MRNLYSILLLLIIFFGVRGYADELTSTHQRVGDESRANITFGDSLSESSDVVILAENGHGNPRVENFNIETLRTFASSTKGKICYFSEFDMTASSVVSDFQSSKGTYQETIGDFNQQMGFARNLLPRGIAEAAKSLKMEIIPVDVSWKSSVGKRIAKSIFRTEGYVKTYIGERNRIMARQIVSAIKEKACDRSVYVVGANHTLSELNGIAVTPLQSLLASEYLNTQVFGVSEQGIRHQININAL